MEPLDICIMFMCYYFRDIISLGLVVVVGVCLDVRTVSVSVFRCVCVSVGV